MQFGLAAVGHPFNVVRVDGVTGSSAKRGDPVVSVGEAAYRGPEPSA